MGATPWTNWVWPLLNVCVHDGMTLLARAKYSRDFANERLAVGSMASLSPPLGHDAVRPYRLRVAFVARRAAVDRLELGLALQKREDVVHAERLAQATVDRTNSRSAGPSTVQRRCERFGSCSTFSRRNRSACLQTYGVTCSRSEGAVASRHARSSASNENTSVSRPSGNVGGCVLLA